MPAVAAWVSGPMPELNRDIIAGRRPPGEFPVAVTAALAGLPAAPQRCTPLEARRLVVLLGLAGAALGRHHQERDTAHRRRPERAFDLPVGEACVPFLDYFTGLAEQTGAGHPDRDAYASLTRWNLPATEVWWGEARLATLPGVFDDGQVRTYTGERDETGFFELIKLSETYERAVNLALAPIAEESVDVCGADAVHRLGVAAELLDALRRLNTGFAALPAGDGLRAGHFMDVFRQFAVHWRPGDVPPSGALDPEAIERDLLLGIDLPGHRAHLARLRPGLLAGEWDRLTAVMDRPGLPRMLLARLGAGTDLSGRSPAGLRALLGSCPALAALYLVLRAHARVSSAHLMLAKKYLFAPQRDRDRTGAGDTGVVSNRRGTTGMDERTLERLVRLRGRHPLRALRRLPTADLESLAGVDALRRTQPPRVRFAPPSPPPSDPPSAALVRPRPPAGGSGGGRPPDAS
ncbi:hypothetical protein Daura_35180 [Dactylosporangium aurantiacum]|uniref:Uncharacterized protein n=1 Tax=Dactylosporangium aurantiacum TaxID=35754 RepID=A0A9Q9MDC2_9ACTN|nr:hypothetical protein [Dactylosporangium aurantiacum]MDG6103583.1 hypothetical protein [Dactylosporangium aurantiacum]UWZ51924.1 hypothetical protein Daura_35180 [Dactylosporangium aurantiacum]